MKKLIIIALALNLLFSTTACEKVTDQDKIAAAQACLDRATVSEAESCVSKVDGLESSGAYLIRCAGKFVKEGFNDSSKLATALAAIEDDTGAEGSTAMMALISFSAEDTMLANSASATQAFEYCKKSESEGLIQLAGLANIATTVAYLQNLAEGFSGMDLQTAMAAAANDPVAQAAIGAAVVGVYESNCSGSNSAAGDYCTQFESVVNQVPGGVENPAAIGQKAMLCYSDPGADGCSGF